MKLWYYKQEGKGGTYDIFNPNTKLNTYVCQVCGEEEAKQIITAVNCHEELVEGLTGMIGWTEKTAMHYLQDTELLPRGFDKWKQALKKVGE